MIRNVIILNKLTKEEQTIPARDFLNPKSSTYAGKTIKPFTFNQAYTTLLDLLEGQIYQNIEYAVKLEGVEYRWDWKNQP